MKLIKKYFLQGKYKNFHICNNCEKEVEAWFYYWKKSDFTICFKCFEKIWTKHNSK